ncbi:MAG: hypothetical protein FWF67_02835 [Fibromonadales bacterium]|nr:hypothetical protein [Fibromonadales bacterium]
MIRFVKPMLISIFLAVGFAQATDIIGEYCVDAEDQKLNETKKLGPANQIGTKELKALINEAASGKECYIFQANNKVTYTAEKFKIKLELPGIYRLKDNGNLFVLPGYAMKGNFDSIYVGIGQDGVNQLMVFNKKHETKTLDMAVLAECSKVINQTQDGLNSCIKEQSQQMANSQKTSEENFENELLKHGGIFSIAGHTLHKLNDHCKSSTAYIKKGSKASAYVSYDESKQFCFNGEVLDKCGGKSYDPKEQACGNNILFSKCGNSWYEASGQYCFKHAVKDKELTDSRDGKRYRTAKIGTQTWMGENLDYHGEDGYLGLCKDKKPENCEKYGRFYDWAEAAGIDRKYNNEFWKDEKYWENSVSYQGSCPAGWHLPHPRDWQTLINFVGGKEAAEKKLAVESTDEQYLKKCRYLTEDDRGRIIEHNDCPSNEYGFFGTDKDSWWSAPESFEPANIDSSMGAKRAYAYSSWALGIDSKSEIKQVRCLQTPTESQILAEVEAKEKAEKEITEARAKESAKGGEIQLGLRIAYNSSTVLYEGENSDLGHGAEAGIIVNIPILNTPFEISIGANGIYRRPVVYRKYFDSDNNESDVRSELTEYVASIPAFFKWNISSFFLQIGAQVDIPLQKKEIITKGEEVVEEQANWRNRPDLGVAFGLGWRINESFAIDAKMVGSATEFNKEEGGYKLIQGSTGFSYFF